MTVVLKLMHTLPVHPHKERVVQHYRAEPLGVEVHRVIGEKEEWTIPGREGTYRNESELLAVLESTLS